MTYIHLELNDNETILTDAAFFNLHNLTDFILFFNLNKSFLTGASFVNSKNISYILLDGEEKILKIDDENKMEI